MYFIRLFVRQQYDFFECNQAKKQLSNFDYCPSPFVNLSLFWKLVYILCNHGFWNLIPFSSLLWYKKTLTNEAINQIKTKRKVCLYVSGIKNHYSMAMKILLHIKKKHPNIRFVFVFEDTVSYYKQVRTFSINKMKSFFDIVYSYNESDLKNYGLKKIQPYIRDYSNIKNFSFSKCDLFFVGQNKGRLQELIRIYEICANEGLSCDFHVNGVPENEQLHPTNIFYNSIIPYDEVLERCKCCKCIVDIVQNGVNGMTLREYEAIGMNKLLLTNNPAIYESPFYTPEKVIWINDLKTEIQRIKDQTNENVEWNNKKRYTINYRFESIINDLNEAEN